MVYYAVSGIFWQYNGGYFVEYEHLKRFAWKDANIFANKMKIGNWSFFSEMAVIGAFSRCAIAEKVSVNIYFYRHFLIPIIYLPKRHDWAHLAPSVGLLKR